MSVSPLAPESFPALPPVGGVQLASHAAGLRYQARADLMMAVVPAGTTVAGTLTQSLCPSAPVDWCRRLLPSGAGRAIVCNAGNANAFTGRAGDIYTIYRRGREGFPPIVLGELGVLSVFEKASLARVLRSRYAIYLGDPMVLK